MVTNLQATFGAMFKVVDDGTDDSDRAERVWAQEIPGRYGTIYPSGWDGSLAVRVESKRVAHAVAKLGLRVIQRGEYETVFVFPVSLFSVIARMVQSRRRRQLSPEEKLKRVARLRRPSNSVQPRFGAEERGLPS